MQAPAFADRFPAAAGWCLVYGVIALSWIGLVAMSGAAAGLPAVPANIDAFIARCLGSAAGVTLPSLVSMWALMSLGMMLPTALPALQRLSDLLRPQPRAPLLFLSFSGAYVLVWLGFSVSAALLQALLATAGLLDEAGRAQNALLAAVLLGFAGAYQFSRLKHACLSRCRHPMTFFLAQWRSGSSGAFLMGLKHGRDCLGCCWPLMLLAFVGGTMNLLWMALAMVLMLIEKLAGAGRYVTAPLGVVLVLAAGFALGQGLQAL